MDVGHVVGDTYGAKIGVRAGVVAQRMAGLDPTLERAAIVVGLHAGPVDETPYPRDAVAGAFERREQTLVDLVTSAALRLRGSNPAGHQQGCTAPCPLGLGRPISGWSFNSEDHDIDPRGLGIQGTGTSGDGVRKFARRLWPLRIRNLGPHCLPRSRGRGIGPPKQ